MTPQPRQARFGDVALAVSSATDALLDICLDAHPSLPSGVGPDVSGATSVPYLPLSP